MSEKFNWFDFYARHALETPRRRRGRYLPNLSSQEECPIQSICGLQTFPKLRKSSTRLKDLSKKSSTSRFRVRKLELLHFKHRSTRRISSRPAGCFASSAHLKLSNLQYYYIIS